MTKPIRTTVILAFVFGFSFLPLSLGAGPNWLYPSIFQLVLWAQLAIYSVLLARWSHTRLTTVLYPLLLGLAVAILPGPFSVFGILFVGILCWIRSGICFPQTRLRGLFAELVTVGGGVVLLFFLVGGSMLSWSLGLALFGLVQALYFFIVPVNPKKSDHEISLDPFTIAYGEAEKIIGA